MAATRRSRTNFRHPHRKGCGESGPGTPAVRAPRVSAQNPQAGARPGPPGYRRTTAMALSSELRSICLL